ncbi:MAG: HlyD family efflux transporter periplasmic adaptor subunit [Phycisphaerales bacterium]|nr:HlyD family efflux transporter periplasmic adaptor subunit [Phycisphaerales bacterium]
MDGEDHMFRDRAVDSVAAADRINQVAPIVSARLWLLVAGGGVLCAALLGWSLLGRVPLTVRGTGILIEGTMVVAAESPADGRIAEVRVKPGDVVRQGDVIAVIANPALEAQRADAESAVARLKEQHLAMLAAEDTAMRAAERSSASERAELAVRIAGDRHGRENAIAESAARVRHAAALLDAERNVAAPRPGRVARVMRAPGDSVRRGSPVAVVSDAVDGVIRCHAFFPLAEGKRVRTGMVARVEPSIADRERFGIIRGSVGEMDPLVGTHDSLSRIAGSPELAADIERRHGAVVSGVVDLEPDPSTPTGLRWTGGTGYPQPLSAGTPCDVDVVTEEVAPVSLFLPWLRQAFGG